MSIDPQGALILIWVLNTLVLTAYLWLEFFRKDPAIDRQ